MPTGSAYSGGETGGGVKTTGGMIRKNIKSQYKKLAGGGSLVSDAETEQFQQGMQKQAEQAIGAQQQALNRQAMAAQAGSPVMAGAMQAGAQKQAGAAADAAVKATGASQAYKTALHEKRAAQIQAAAERQRAQNREDLATATETSFRMVEAGNIFGSMFGG